MATKKKKSAAKAKKAPAKAPARKASGTPKWLNNAIRYAEKNPGVAIAGLIAVALGIMFIFTYKP